MSLPPSHGAPTARLSSPLTKGACASLSWMYRISRARRRWSLTTLSARPPSVAATNTTAQSAASACGAISARVLGGGAISHPAPS